MKLQQSLRIPRAPRTAWLAGTVGATALLAMLMTGILEQPGTASDDVCRTASPDCTVVGKPSAAGGSHHARILEWIRMPFFSFARPLRGGRRL